MITQCKIDNKYNFVFNKFWTMQDAENNIRLAMFSDGFVWAFEPELHDTEEYLDYLGEWFDVVYRSVKSCMCSRAFSLLVKQKTIDDFAYSCLQHNRLVPWTELISGGAREWKVIN